MGGVNTREGKWAWAILSYEGWQQKEGSVAGRGMKRGSVSWSQVTTIRKVDSGKPLQAPSKKPHWRSSFWTVSHKGISIQSMKIASSPSQIRKHLPFSLSSKEVFTIFSLPSLCHKPWALSLKMGGKGVVWEPDFAPPPSARALPVLGMGRWEEQGKRVLNWASDRSFQVDWFFFLFLKTDSLILDCYCSNKVTVNHRVYVRNH